MASSRHRVARFLIGLAMLEMLAATPSIHAGELQVLTEEYPPISFTLNGHAAGFGSEVVAEIQRRIGSRATIQIMPWARGYQMLLQKSDVALFATMRTTEREDLFKWVGPLTTVKTSFYAKRDAILQIDNLADAKKFGPILVPRQYYSHQFLETEGFTEFEAVNSPEIMVRMLINGRRPLMAADNLTLAHCGPRSARPGSMSAHSTHSCNRKTILPFRETLQMPSYSNGNMHSTT